MAKSEYELSLLSSNSARLLVIIRTW